MEPADDEREYVIGDRVAVDPTPIRVFLSYARSDDAEFGLVDPFVNKIKALVKAKSGRALDVFVDRDAIGWGENWRERLAESVEGATVFLPLLTATYLERPACREEFLAFHAKAETLSVTDLLLPVLVFRSPLFSPESSDEIVRISEARQYKCIEDALLAGFDSPPWLACMSELASALVDALTRAEDALAPVESAVAYAPATRERGSESQSTVGVVDDDEDDGGGLAEYMIAMQSSVDEMNQAAESLSPTMEAFSEATDAIGNLPENATPKQMQAWAIRLASGFKQPSLDLERDGKQMFAAATKLDEALTGIKRLTLEIDDPEISAPLEYGLTSIVTSFGDLAEVEQSMEDLLTAIKPAEVFSVPLRKSLRPARRGLTSVRDTLQLVASWRSLLNDLEDGPEAQ